MNSDLSSIQTLINKLIELSVVYSFQIIAAIIILIVGGIVASWASKATFRILQKKNIDVTLSNFLADVAKIIVFAFALIIAAGKFGITIAPFIAALSAVAFGASFALQGPLANYGAGISIILSRPYIIGDTITLDSITGVVTEVKLACTVLVNEDGVKITIPSNKIVGQILYNSGKHKVVELQIGVDYDSDVIKAVEIVQNTILSFPEVCKNPAPNIGVEKFGDSAIMIGYRYWIPTIVYFDLMYKINQAIHQAVKSANISVPYPQMDVRLIQSPVSPQVKS